MNEQYYIVEIPHQRSPRAYGPMTEEEIISLAGTEQTQWLADNDLWDTELTLAQAIGTIWHDLAGCHLIPAEEVVETLESWRELWRDPRNHGFPAAFWRLAEAIADSEYAEDGPVKMLKGFDITDPTAERLLGMLDFCGHYPIAAPSDTPGGWTYTGEASDDADECCVVVEDEIWAWADDVGAEDGYRVDVDGDGTKWGVQL
jgi:hypothetical protein